MNNYCIYLRKSRSDKEAEEHGESETLARHQKTLLDLAHNKNLNITAIYKEIVSGENISSRPQMQRLLSEVELGIWDGVLVMEIERLARGNTKDQGIVSETFKYSNTKIITPNKIYDPNNEFDEEYFEFGLFMSRREYKTINRRLQRGRIASINEGKYVGNIAPYGYKRIKIQGQKGFTLEPVEPESNIVKLIFQLYTKGLPDDGFNSRIGISRICSYLNDLNIKPRKSEIWVISTIQTILKNPVYIGKVKWNCRPAVKTVVNGIVKITRPRSKDFIIADGLHKPIIDENTFYTAQNYLKHNRAVPIQLKNTISNPLSGLIKCGICGRTMLRRPYYNSKQPDELICNISGCKNISSKLADVEEALIKALQYWLSEYKINWNLEQDKAQNNLLFNISMSNLKKEIENKELLTKQLENLHDLLEQRVYSIEKFLERSENLSKKIEKSNSKIKELETFCNKAKLIQNNKKEIIPKIENVLELYSISNNTAFKNQLLKEVIEKAVYIKETKNTKSNKEKKFKLIIYPKIPKSFN